MTEADRDRDRLRRLQDAWLDHPDTREGVERLRREGLTDHEIVVDGQGSPTLHQVIHLLFPAWESFFRGRVG